jgi:hypothetical protein
VSYPDDIDLDAITAGLDATPAERQALAEVLAEVGDYPDDGGPYGGEPAPDDSAAWDGFHAATAAMDQAHALDAQRLAEDVSAQLDRRPSSETILARAMERIGRGTYTEPPGFLPAVADAYLVSHPACGEVTEFGTCSARYHAAGCGAVIAGAAAAGTAEDAGAWAAALASRPPDPGALPYSAELAEPSGPEDTFADLLRPSGSAHPATVHARILAGLGEGGPPPDPGYEPFPPETMPDVTGLRANLGC